MRLLLDTHVVLWAATGSPRLTSPLRTLLQSAENTLVVSAATHWEISIKNSLGRPDFDVDLVALRAGLRANGYVDLPVTAEHAAVLAGLPDLHRDPFDRMLVAQALSEGLTLVTADTRILGYPVSTIEV
ncbi:type II toxin-antitoxin system VapC family toxin [Agreia pratensis]|uniref:PIN domain nuclease, a component of toxin-antitoxin system (PIN domain) n=1 Tax=Agreia pratensis TaxID=150121 RepID=A0A1X7J9G0_9MICO|nr:type II toxin-antitoxin system VapC family toxin [Agreia pratensis]MBF4635640.1 type II toxin-antitoxin system VapC family toxin [Agreia pratensis]SMG23615.1 PIN domain nuclease, a component of toxin-antitoxin system (PIN domain) [Agreia pratensis]